MSKLTVNCKCGKTFEVGFIDRFACPNCDIVYIKIRTGFGDDDYTWEIEK